MNKKSINVDNSRDPFTIYSSRFAIIMPSKIECESAKSLKPQIREKTWRLFMKVKTKGK